MTFPLKDGIAFWIEHSSCNQMVCIRILPLPFLIYLLLGKLLSLCLIFFSVTWDSHDPYAFLNIYFLFYFCFFWNFLFIKFENTFFHTIYSDHSFPPSSPPRSFPPSHPPNSTRSRHTTVHITTEVMYREGDWPRGGSPKEGEDRWKEV